MQTTSFGREAVTISRVGLGAWQLGSDAWGEMDDAQARAILDRADAGGVTFIDTADVYGGGESERRIGRFLAETGAQPFVATKLGRGDGLYPDRYDYDDLRRVTEASLERLGVDCLDLTQLHCVPTEVLRDGAVFDHLRRLRDEGLIRRFGASVESVAEGLLCLEQDELSSLQIIFNIFRQKPIDELLPRARERGVAIIVRLPLASGLLAGKFTAETKFPAGDHRHFNEDGQSFNVGETFAGLGLAAGTELADKLKPLVPKQMTMAQMALRWCLDFEAVTVVIPGASRPEQADANIAAADLPPLGAELHAKLRAFYADHRIAERIRGPY